MEASVANANGDSRADARLGWLTSPNGRSKLRRVDASTGNAGQFLWDKNSGTVLGQVAQATTNVPYNLTKGSGTNLTSLAYGDFTNLIVNLFGGRGHLVQSLHDHQLGYYQIYAYQESDVQVARPGGFVVPTG